jgi:hypothetical protein
MFFSFLFYLSRFPSFLLKVFISTGMMVISKYRYCYLLLLYVFYPPPLLCTLYLPFYLPVFPENIFSFIICILFFLISFPIFTTPSPKRDRPIFSRGAGHISNRQPLGNTEGTYMPSTSKCVSYGTCKKCVGLDRRRPRTASSASGSRWRRCCPPPRAQAAKTGT